MAPLSAEPPQQAQFPIFTEHQLLTYLQERGLRGVALDIDETLSWTVGHWLALMQQLFGNPEGLTPKEMADKYHLAQFVPHWQGRPEVEAWMHERRADNALQEELPLVDGALAGANALHVQVPVVAYITVRPQCVLDGTRKWLMRHGFPNAPIVGKPDGAAFENGNAWKAEALHHLYPSVLGIVDDNPGVLKSLPADYRGTFFLFEQPLPEAEQPRAFDAARCETWADVVRIVPAALARAPSAPAPA